MAKRSEFCIKAEEVFSNNSVYIGTGNGERLFDLTIGDILRMEKDYGDNPLKRVRQILELVGHRIENGIDMSKASAGDCSGTIVGILRTMGLIGIKDDLRARDFQRKCKPVTLAELKAGDLVFDKKADATHVGIYVGDGMVIESKGRSYGVVKRKLSVGPWVVGGTFTWWEEETFVLTRTLKYVRGNVMRGDDVKYVQRLINQNDVTVNADGSFGPATEKAVIKYQSLNGLEADGKVGPATCRKLGIAYSTNN